jgi:hypothetical protein
MKTTEAIEAVIKEDGIDSAVEWIAGVVDEKHSRIETLEAALQSLLDVQNGPPLIKYADEWGSAVEAARAALEKKDGD